MSFQEDFLHSGQPRPATNETAQPQLLFSIDQIKSMFYQDFENRLLQIRKSHGIDRAQKTLNAFDLVLIGQQDWGFYKKKIMNCLEDAELQEKMKKEQQEQMLNDRMLEMLDRKKKRKTKSTKTETKIGKALVDKPMTLKYYRHGNNSLLMKQRNRVMLVFRKFNEWGWIDDRTTANDFDALFEGEPRHCNITWTGSTTLLTILLQELLKQPYIEKQTGCSAKSLVEKQFGMTPNSDKSRLDGDAETRISITLYILDISNPIPERQGRDNNNEYDTSDTTLKLLGDKLRSTKAV